MTKHPYSYVVLRYVPDSGSGEGLNFGVALYNQPESFLRLEVDTRYERLSHAFAGFDGKTFRRAVANLRSAFSEAETNLASRPLFNDELSFAAWLKKILPDVGAGFTFTDQRHGVTDNLGLESDRLFDRMVLSLTGQSEERPRQDETAVWRAYERALPKSLESHLRSKSFSTSSVKIDFDHAVKNGRWHVIQPIPMDFAQAESLQRKATQWVGAAVGLKETPDLATMIFLLGAPSAAHKKPYERAKALLNQAPINHQIIEEKDAARLGPLLEQLLAHEE